MRLLFLVDQRGLPSRFFLLKVDGNVSSTMIHSFLEQRMPLGHRFILEFLGSVERCLLQDYPPRLLLKQMA